MNPVAPFAPNAGREGFFEADGLHEALQRLSDARGDREPFLLVTGEPGCGKTTLVREAIARWGESVCAAWLSCPARTDAELVEEVVRRFGAEPPEGASLPRLVACFEQALGEIAAREQLAMIVVDDAHALEPRMLEELRLLVNAAQRTGRRIEVLLVGLPALEAHLQEPALAALRQRVSVRCALEPLSPAETLRYLHHRVTSAGGDGPGLFGRKSCREIATQSRGLPREINLLATEALRRARAAGLSTVSPDHVRASATSLWGRTLPAAVAVAAAGVAPAAVEAPAADAPGAPPATPTPQVAPESSAPKRRVAPPPPLKPAPEASKPAPEASKPAAPPESSLPSASPTPPTPSAAGTTGTDPALRAPAVPQDPREWVKRFVGDRGPVRIGSQTAGPSSWTRDDPAARVVPASAFATRPTQVARTDSPERPEPPAYPTYAPPSAPSQHNYRPPMLVPALVALVMVCLVALLVRASGGFRSRQLATGQVAVRTRRATVSVPAQALSSNPSATNTDRISAGEVGSSGMPSPDVPADSTDAASGTSKWTLDVGTYTNPERAASERDRVHAATGLDAWVVRQSEAGGESYHVVLGIYRSNARASSAADDLLVGGRVSQVRVVPLPPKRSRR